MQFLLPIGVGLLIGCSMFRNSLLVNILINVTGGSFYGFD